MGVKAFHASAGHPGFVAAHLPKEWDVRFVDENIAYASVDEYLWIEVVFMIGMHVQRENILQVNARAHGFGKISVLCGPSVSGCPEYYPAVDILHCGELGDARPEENSTA